MSLYWGRPVPWWLTIKIHLPKQKTQEDTGSSVSRKILEEGVQATPVFTHRISHECEPGSWFMGSQGSQAAEQTTVRLPLYISRCTHMALPGSSADKRICLQSQGEGSGQFLCWRVPWRRYVPPLTYSCLENPHG